MNSLKLNKIKISRIGNPHLLFGGAQQAATNAQQTVPDTIYCHTKDEADNTCQSQTNTGRTGQTAMAGAKNTGGGQN